MNTKFFSAILLRKSNAKLLNVLVGLALVLALLPATSAGAATSYTLTVVNNSPGSGTVTSNPIGISCGVTCSASFDTPVTLTAVANTGSIFTGWSGGGCSGIDTCTLPMTGITTVTATFASAVTISGNAGAGSVTLSTDGSPVWTTTSNSSGDYSLSVQSSWTGTVTPSKKGYSFSAGIHYSSVTLPQTAQNYIATLAGHSSTTYYVDNTVSCDDNGNGVDKPFCKIATAADLAQAGNTISVLHGTYHEKVRPENNGGAGFPITFSAAPGVTVTGDGSATGSAFRLTNMSYITVQGFTVTNTTDHGIYAMNSDHIVISNNHVTLSGSPSVNNDRDGIYFYQTIESTIDANTTDHNTSNGIELSESCYNDTVSNNVSFANASVFDRLATGISVFSNSHDNTIIHNKTYANEDTGLNFYTGANHNFIIGNLSYGNGDHGIDDNDAPNNIIVGNTVQGNVSVGINLEGDSGSGGATVENNISVDNGLNPPSPSLPGNIRVDTNSTGGGTTLDYNIVFHRGSYGGSNVLITWGSTDYTDISVFKSAHSPQEAQGLQSDPLWILEAQPATRPVGGGAPTVNIGDYHLRAGSPAIDSANALLAKEPALDIEGKSRIDDPNTANKGVGTRAYDDRGAYEFQAPICYALTLNTNLTGGSAATASPAKSAECYTAQNYVANTAVALTASPNVGFYTVWSGTDNDTLDLTTNAVTLLNAGKTVNVSYSARITPVLTATGGPYTYDGAEHTATINVTGSIPGSITNTLYTNTNLVSAASAKNADTYAITANFTPSDAIKYYTLTNASAGTLIINKAPLTITANSRTKTYGEAVTFVGTEFGAAGIISPDTVTSVTLTSAGSGASAAVSGSPYAIVPSAAVGTGLVNYTISYVNGQLTVDKATQVINVTSHAPAEITDNFVFDVAATGGDSGSPVVISTSGVCTGSGEGAATITMTGSAGVCAVHYNQAGTSNYTAAVEVIENAAMGMYTISGNAGIDGAVLTYDDGGIQTVTSDAGGNYTLNVTANWSGTVTPSKPNYVFTPANYTYSNVLENKTGQDFTAVHQMQVFLPFVRR